LSSELIRSRSGLTATNSSQGCIRCFTSRTHVPVHSEKAKACSRLESGHIRCESPQMRKCDFCHHSIFVFFCGVLPHCVKSVRTLDLGLFVDGWTLINWLVLILDFRDPESANLVLQGRTFESEPFSRSSLTCNSPGRSSQCFDDYTRFRLSKSRGRVNCHNGVGRGGKRRNRNL
jgi:hypothetical protein